MLAGGGVLGILLLILAVSLAGGGDSEAQPPATPSLSPGAPATAGGPTPSEKITNELRALAKKPISVAVGDRRESLDPAQSGLKLDVEATVGAAVAAGADLATVTATQVPPVVVVDKKKLSRAVAGVAEELDRPVRDGGIRFDGAKAVAVDPREGQTIDTVKAAEVIRAGYLTATGPIQLPVKTVDPKVPAAEVARMLTAYAQPAVASPVTLVVGPGQSVVVSPENIADHLTFAAPDARTLQARLDIEALLDDVDTGGLLRGPLRNATWKFVGTRAVLVPSRAGRSVDVPDLQRRLLDLLPQPGARTLPVALLENVQPTFHTSTARAMGIVERLSTFTQAYPYAAYRVHNISRAARYVDGTVLAPGQMFSLNEAVRPRTEANGYVEGIVINRGRFDTSVGGGVSAFATAMWDAAFYAGLERVEQRAHTLYISRYKAGLEATITGTEVDLVFRNDSPHSVLIKASAGNTGVTVSMWGTKRFDIEAQTGPRYKVVKAIPVYDTAAACKPQQPVDGFVIDVTRVFRPKGGGAVLKAEKLTSYYDPTNKIVCGPAP